MMLAIFAALLSSSPAAASPALLCNVTNREGLYAGGTLEIREETEVTVEWRGSQSSDVILGGTRVCGQETKALQYPTRCRSTFTRPTPLAKLQTICEADTKGSPWVGSLSFVLSPNDGGARLSCRTKLGLYTDFELNLINCREL